MKYHEKEILRLKRKLTNKEYRNDQEKRYILSRIIALIEQPRSSTDRTHHYG